MSTTVVSVKSHRKSAMTQLKEANALSKRKTHRKLDVHARKIPYALQQAPGSQFLLATALRTGTGNSIDLYA